MARRRRSGDRPSEPDEAAGLAGWLYTDLLLGLVVVFLGAIAFVVPALAGGDDGDESVVRPTTPSTTTTTTTIPTLPRTCRSLLPTTDERDDSILVFIPTRLGDDELRARFEESVTSQLLEYSFGIGAQRDPPLSLSYDQLEVGLALASGYGSQGGQNDARELVDRLRLLLPNEMGVAVGRYFWTTQIPSGQVRLELLPYVDGPC